MNYRQTSIESYHAWLAYRQFTQGYYSGPLVSFVAGYNAAKADAARTAHAHEEKRLNPPRSANHAEMVN